jgi:hypothetical protein
MRDRYGEKYSAKEILVAMGITLIQFLSAVVAFVVTLWAIVFGLVWCLGALFYSPPAVTWQNFVMYGTIFGAPLLFLGVLIWEGGLRDRFWENVREARRIYRSSVLADEGNVGK